MYSKNCILVGILSGKDHRESGTSTGTVSKAKKLGKRMGKETERIVMGFTECRYKYLN